MNEWADSAATKAHGKATKLPPLTGWMRSYVVWSEGKGYSPDNWLSDFRQALVEIQVKNETEAMRKNLRDPTADDTGEPVDYYYTRAPSGTTGKFQLLLRLNQFPTRKRQHRDKIVDSPACDLCGCDVQDEKHIFVDCPVFTEMREEGLRKCFTFRKPVDKAESEVPRTELEKYYRETLFGSDRWEARPWLGLVPVPQEPLHKKESGTAHHLAIILTSQIAGEYFRKRLRSKTASDPSEPVARPLAIIGRPRRSAMTKEKGT